MDLRVRQAPQERRSRHPRRVRGPKPRAARGVPRRLTRTTATSPTIPYILDHLILPIEDSRKRACANPVGCSAQAQHLTVSPLFRRSEEKAARKAAANLEIQRLRALSVEDLAAEMFPALGPDGPTHGTSIRAQQLAAYLLREHPRAGQMTTIQLMSAVRKALYRLEEAGLASPISVQREPVWRITPLGERALAEGAVRRQLTGAG